MVAAFFQHLIGKFSKYRNVEITVQRAHHLILALALSHAGFVPCPPTRPPLRPSSCSLLHFKVNCRRVTPKHFSVHVTTQCSVLVSDAFVHVEKRADLQCAVR